MILIIVIPHFREIVGHGTGQHPSRRPLPVLKAAVETDVNETGAMLDIVGSPVAPTHPGGAYDGYASPPGVQQQFFRDGFARIVGPERGLKFVIEGTAQARVEGEQG